MEAYKFAVWAAIPPFVARVAALVMGASAVGGVSIDLVVLAPGEARTKRGATNGRRAPALDADRVFVQLGRGAEDIRAVSAQVYHRAWRGP